MGTPNSFNLIKIVKIVSPLIAFGVSFVLLLFCMNVVTGDIATLVYGGVMTPEYLSSQNPTISLEELAQLQSEYDQTKRELNIPDFPFNLIYVMFHYIILDFGTNWETDQPIFEEYLASSGVSVRLILSSLLTVFALLFLLMVRLDKSKQIININSKGTTYIRILGIISPFFLLLWTFFCSEIVIKGGLSTFVSLVWREDMSILSNLILPVSLTTILTIIPGLISLAFGASNRTVFKISGVAIIISSLWTEAYFWRPGIGRQCYRAFMIRNYPVQLAGIIWIAIIIVIFLMFIELFSYNFLDEIPKKQRPLNKILSELSLLKQNYRKMVLEVIIIGVLVLFLVVLYNTYLFAPFHPTEDDYTSGFPSYAPPGGEHLLGTDWAGQDVFSRILFACSNIVTFCVPFGALSVSGYIVFSAMNQKLRTLTNLILSFLIIITFLSYSGIIPLFSEYTHEYGPVTVITHFLVTLGFSTGFIVGTWKEQNDIFDFVRNLRQIFSFSVMFQLMLIEFLSFTTPFVAPGRLITSFGLDLRFASTRALDEFPWLLAPLVVLIFIFIILAGFALVEVPIDLLNKLNEIFRKRTAPQISV